MQKLPSPLLDVGTGAGFPGIPLRIAVPTLKLILAEPRPRRVQFLKEARKTLKFSNVDIFDHKVTSQSLRIPVKAVITRALEHMDKTLLRTSAALEKGGLAIFMKGPNADEELLEVKRRLGDDFKLRTDRGYKIPHTPHERRLIIFEKRVERSLTVPVPVGDENEPSGEEFDEDSLSDS